jgi:hypothetical protein
VSIPGLIKRHTPVDGARLLGQIDDAEAALAQRFEQSVGTDGGGGICRFVVG